jgi:hypothetical protein
MDSLAVRFNEPGIETNKQNMQQRAQHYGHLLW